MSSKNYRPGDVDINGVTIISQRGSAELKNSFVSGSIYESIFTPGIYAELRVLDTNDILGNMRLLGDETVTLNIGVLGRKNVNFVFSLYELAELENVGSQSGKMYTLRCVSEEAMHAKTNTITKSYTDLLCSEMINDIHKNYLKSTKPLIIEPTQSPQRIIIPTKKPYEAIELVRRRSVSIENPSSVYTYFENHDNNRQTFNFVTIEKLFKGNIIKNFQLSNAINTTIYAKGDDNILAFSIPQQFNAVNRISYGGPRRVAFFNFATWQYESVVIDTNDKQHVLGGSASLYTPSFRNRYFNEENPPISRIPVDIIEKPLTSIPENTPNFESFIASISQNAIKIKVIGDIILMAGKIINCTLPNKNAFTTNKNEDKLISGNFLISRIHHRIAEPMNKPRYTCCIEAIKGNYEQ